jgi:DNA-directed RNA polymerase specialized sigma24 family protein
LGFSPVHWPFFAIGEDVSTESPTVTWNDIPTELQQRVLERGVDAVDELALWAYQHRPLWMEQDHLDDLLCALMVFLIRTSKTHGVRIRSLPAVLASIAYRQKCQRLRDAAYQAREQLAVRDNLDPTPLTQVERLEDCARLHSALRCLSRDERFALLRKHGFGDSYRQIAIGLYGRTSAQAEGRVSVMLTRARRTLRGLLEDGFVR